MKPSVLGFVVVCAAAASACGGFTSPTTGPSPIFSPAPASAPGVPATPIVPAPVSYPSAVAAWTGTRLISAVYSDGQPRATTSCEETWIIRSQSGGSFSGTFQSTGSGTCAQSGTLNGTISFTGAISDLTFSSAVGDNPECTRSSDNVRYAGTLSAKGITAQAGDRMQCAFTRGSATAERSISITMTRF